MVPSVDIEGIGNPETDEIPWAPLSACRLDYADVRPAHDVHRMQDSPGFKSSFVSINCVLLKPGSVLTASLLRTCPALDVLSVSIAGNGM
jgi:hypothetical protein